MTRDQRNWLSLAIVLLCASGNAWAQEVIDLSGKWALRLDDQNVGCAEHWYEHPFSDPIQLPGSLQEQGYGRDVSTETAWTGSIVDRSWFTEKKYERYRQPGNVKVPFWLQPKKHYIGPAWYQRTVEVPRAWFGRRIVLRLERPHWETRLWVDGAEVGMRNSLGTPHEYDLTDKLVPAAGHQNRHRLTIRVDNTVGIKVGDNAHSVTDHTQSNWNGIVGSLSLMSTDRIWIDDVQVHPDLDARSATVRVRVGNMTGRGGNGTLTLTAEGFNSGGAHCPAPHKVPISLDPKENEFEVKYPLGDRMCLWDEFDPALYRLSVVLDARVQENSLTHECSVVFGMRKIATEGTQFTINGRKLFFRGTLECSIFPLTGYPAMDVDSWKRIIRICQAHGLNHMRFHSWCPPEAAFVAADECGFYLQVECGAWAAVGTGQPIDQWLYEEGRRITTRYGNHPSFVLMAYGNEPSGPERGARFLRDWCTYWKSRDPRRLYTSAAGWPLISESDYHNPPDPRIQRWGAGLTSVINAQPPQTRFDHRAFVEQHADKPTISHEIGQWCVYPDFQEIPKYRGVLKAKNFEIFRDTLEANHMGDQARDFLMASGKLQTLCYKADIEAALRTPGFGGFQLLDLHDFPGQGTALIGVLDPFWNSKPYVTPEQFRRFCDSTVPLARMDKRVVRKSETLSVDVEMAHFGNAPLSSAVVYWKLLDANDDTVREGRFAKKVIPLGSGIHVGQIHCSFANLAAPANYKLVVGIKDTTIENGWNIWVYPDVVDTAVSGDIHLTSELDQAAMRELGAGGKVLLLADPKRVNSDVAIGFSSIFWNTAWTRGQAPHTLGILCKRDHGAFASFPTDYHSDWQWWELIHGSSAMVLDGLPPQLRPLIQPIDTWFENRRLGLLVEASVAGGSLMICSMDLSHDLDQRIVARQMRHSLLAYMRSDQFRPETAVAVETVKELFRPLTPLQRLGAELKASSQEPGYEVDRLTDGNSDTIWHTRWTGGIAGYPHEITIDLQRDVVLHALRLLPRQDNNPNGWIGEIAVFASDDGEIWKEPSLLKATLPDNAKWKRINFPHRVRTRYLRLVAIAPCDPTHPWASLAELDLVIPTSVQATQ